MPIQFDEKNQFFHLFNDNFSYVIGIEKNRYLTHRYWGKRLPFYAGSNALQRIDRGFATNPFPEERTFSLNELPLEMSTQGNGDHRIPNFQIRSNSGHDVTDFHYQSYSISHSKKPLPALPSLRQNQSEVTTLTIRLVDSQQNLALDMIYTLFEDLSILTRSTAFTNQGLAEVYLENAGSMSVDMANDQLDLLTLYGSHTNEANISRQALRPGIQKIESSRGTSSPQHQPFLALMDPFTTEFDGEVFAFHFIYSGNFIAQVEREQYGSTRVQMGINPDHFEWVLKPQATFYTPEVVLNYSSSGINGMSQNFHTVYQQHLVNPVFKTKERPILLNTWEANYFDLSEKKLLDQAKQAAEVGIELFVVDDGWFVDRNAADSSLGDWQADLKKLPNGLKTLSKNVHNLGMQFGLWFEPEMVSRKSQLFQQHPDWALQVPSYPMTEGRQQLVLDLSRTDVQDYLIDTLSKQIQENAIDYIKWDMNRHLTEVGSLAFSAKQQKEIGHRYVLGLYHILEVLTTKFPNCLFENCSSGGGRFDPGMMYYMPQTWTSDNSDALCRSLIQYGYSYLYPPIMMGAHVSTVPNHQVGRFTPLDTRAWLAMSGNLGYELDLQTLSSQETEAIAKQISFYKKYRQLFQFAKFYRLQAPNQLFQSAWLFINEQEAMVICFNGLAQAAHPIQHLKLHYFQDDALYEEQSTQQRFSGVELNQAGILITRIKEDFHTFVFHYKKVGSC
ncbi:alpha-galactosidase [Tetragenococcus halophilus]|uniref:Alpha-galactosidase n=1 Tax=Tetragenococcus halophilus TaxID=51669 RepID=A0AB35HP90_TETHA|nr:alpha-galactosidase [Tetragenococcus halophilus]MCO8298088.1 alpha-galactosidase [Tetragenococcus halophilus]